MTVHKITAIRSRLDRLTRGKESFGNVCPGEVKIEQDRPIHLEQRTVLRVVKKYRTRKTFFFRHCL